MKSCKGSTHMFTVVSGWPWTIVNLPIAINADDFST
jgi:hypothetical protein